MCLRKLLPKRVILLCSLTRLHIIEVRQDYEKDVTGLKVVLLEKSGITKVFGLLTILYVETK